MAKKIEVGEGPSTDKPSAKPNPDSVKDLPIDTDATPGKDTSDAVVADSTTKPDEAPVPQPAVAVTKDIPAADTAAPADDTNKPGITEVLADDDADDQAADVQVQPLNISSSGQKPRHHRTWYWLKTHKLVSVPLLVLLALAVLAAIPYTRYLLAGSVVRKDFTVTVVDSQTAKPITSATVRLEGKDVVTDSQGKAVIRANVGNAQLAISKKYYKDASAGVLVPFSQKQPYSVTLVATGRQVPVSVTNKISGKPVENAKVLAESSEALTDKNGEATIVLPANLKEAKGSISVDGMNKINVTVKVTTAKDTANTFSVTPAGKLYFLSNASGKIDVVKSDLDGQNRQTVLAGNGKEDKNNTVLFASTDWKYLALLSKRDSDKGKIYLIETDSDKVTTMDEGDAGFTMVGWNGHQFVYKVDRNNIQYWQAKHTALKSFDAESKKLVTLDETAGEGGDYYNAAYESMGSVFILDGEIAYNKNWYYSGSVNVQSKVSTLNSVKQTAASKKVIKEFNINSRPVNIDIRPYGPNDLYIQLYDNSANKYVYYEYEDGKVTETKDLNDTAYYSGYPTYLISPDGNRMFWTDARDGKSALFVGNGNAEAQKQVGLLKDYNAYGWYTDKYLLLSKESSELYIIPVSGLAEGKSPSKVSDYYRPSYGYNGYGRGYGGQ